MRAAAVNKQVVLDQVLDGQPGPVTAYAQGLRAQHEAFTRALDGFVESMRLLSEAGRLSPNLSYAVRIQRWRLRQNRRAKGWRPITNGFG